MILNNCTTCGRKPERKTIADENYFECKCGRTVRSLQFSLFWTPEVAADMWNRANPQEEEVRRDYLNYLAAEICKAGLSVCFDEHGDMLFTGKVKTPLPNLAMECIKYRNELTEFYKKRLERGVKA